MATGFKYQGQDESQAKVKMEAKNTGFAQYKVNRVWIDSQKYSQICRAVYYLWVRILSYQSIVFWAG